MRRDRTVKSKRDHLYRESLKILPRETLEVFRSVKAIVVTGEIRQLVLEFFVGNEEKTDLWFKWPNPLLGGIAPDRMIALGRGDRLLRFVRQQLAQNERPHTE